MFDKAFYVAMGYESGEAQFKYWEPAVIAGLIDTKEHRNWCGYTTGKEVYKNGALDRGGETKFGIAKASSPEVDVTNLTMAGAKEIYIKKYWNVVRADELSDLIAVYMFDSACGSGPYNAIKFLQRALGVKDDAVFGDKTLWAVQHTDQKELLIKLIAQRKQHYLDIVSNHPEQAVFLKGWNRRADGFIDAYLKL